MGEYKAMNNRILFGGAVSALALVSAVGAHAQVTTGSIRGEVTSETGATVPGATVTVTHEPTGTVVVARTNANGVFNARNLRVGGPFTVEVSANGFVSEAVSDLFLGLNETERLAIDLATEGDRIVVMAPESSAPGSVAGVGSSYGLDTIEGFASISRDPRDFARLDPFASVDVTNDQLSFAGTNNRFNNFTIDGIRQSDLFGLNSSGFPSENGGPISISAIEALSVNVVPFDVEYGGFTGGSVDAVVKSGGNDFFGSAEIYYTDQRFAGGSTTDSSVETFVATLGGPIVEDKLFFFVAYEEFNRTEPLFSGPEGSGAINEVTGITLDDTAEITAIMRDVYGIETTDYPDAPLSSRDIKWVAKLDWNINADHRASFTFNSNDGNDISERSDFYNIGMPSTWYDRSETTEAYALQAFSNWDQFLPGLSTEVKIGYNRQETGQNSIDGADFALAAITLDSGVDVTVGPDRFRHANALENELWQYKFKAEYALGDHLIKAGIERDEQDVFNLFIPASEGIYEFASLDDFRNRTGILDEYTNAITNDELDGAAVFGFATNAVYVQDSWDVTADLNIVAGLRYESYSSDEDPTFNQTFEDRFGFANNNSLDGLDVLLPRIGFTYTPAFETDYISDITLRGGVGKFSDTNVTVWISNSYSNDGVTIDTTSLDDTLTDIDLTTLPLAAQNDLSAGDGTVNAIADDFELFAITRYNLGAQAAFDIPYLGDDWLFGFDFLYSDYENAAYWYDPYCVEVDQAPDGRPIYGNVVDGVTTIGCDVPSARFDDAGNVTANDARERTDVVLGSSDIGESTILAFTASKDWDNGISLFASYTNQDVKTNGQGTSSTATSNYSDFATADRNSPTLGIGRDETEHDFKLQLGWDGEMFEGYETRVQLFANRRSGRTYSYSFDNEGQFIGSAGGGFISDGAIVNGVYIDDASVFGISESRADDAGGLFYVPEVDPSTGLVTATSDPLVTYGNGFDFEEFNALLAQAGLLGDAGIVGRNEARTRWSTIVDLSFRQELPAFGPSRFSSMFSGNERATLYIDIENVGNLLNDEWGLVESRPGDGSLQLINLNEIANGQYVYDSIAGEGSSFLRDGLNTSTLSLWQIQFGLKYEF